MRIEISRDIVLKFFFEMLCFVIYLIGEDYSVKILWILIVDEWLILLGMI